MINLEWVQHRAGLHQMFPSTTDVTGCRRQSSGDVVCGASSRRKLVADAGPSRLNQPPHRAGCISGFAEQAQCVVYRAVTSVSFGSEQYVWINDGPNSHPDPDHPPVATLLPGPPATFTLSKARSPCCGAGWPVSKT